MFDRFRKPRVSFLIAGMQKAGTTALAHFLRQHPQIYLPGNELHFFDRDERDWSGPGRRDYHRLFRQAPRGSLLGEKTPIYTFWPNALERVKAYNPSMRLIISLRSPVDRAHSHWKMETARGREVMPFSRAIREGRKRIIGPGAPDKSLRLFSYVERGFYAPQIARSLSLFGPEQVHVLTSDQLKTAMAGKLDRICDFLELSRFEDYPEQETVRPRLAATPPAPTGNEAEVTTMSRDDREFLQDIFRDDILRTQELTGINLSAWLE